MNMEVIIYSETSEYTCIIIIIIIIIIIDCNFVCESVWI
jgi:hypothetical protein